MDLQGTVRNARDGSVEIEVAGAAEALDRFEDQLARGPAHARVESLESVEPGAGSLPAGFEIVR